MTTISRRNFVKAGAAASAAYALFPGSSRVQANPLGLPLGLQLYSVRQLLAKDFDGTLRQLAALGYREVEAAGFYDRGAVEVARSMRQAGLRCVSAHYPMPELQSQPDDILRFAEELQLGYVVCSSPGFKDPARVQGLGWEPRMEAMTLEDWRYSAAELNRIGERFGRAGIRLGYHNHRFEFRRQGGVTPYDELLRWTDPGSVVMEMDCGWVVVGGSKPEDYLAKYPDRFAMLHVKDFRFGGPAAAGGDPPAAELGRGSIDYSEIFARARKAGVKHCFVEQEEFPDLPAIEALKVDAEYMRRGDA